MRLQASRCVSEPLQAYQSNLKPFIVSQHIINEMGGTHADLISDIGVGEEQLKALSLLVLQLPETNYHTLRLLLGFLKEVVHHQSANRMTAANVATVMGPSLFPLPASVAKANRKHAAKSLTQGAILFSIFIYHVPHVHHVWWKTPPSSV